MEKNKLISINKVNTEHDIEQIANLATIIWHEHYGAILSPKQIDYMIDKFQSSQSITDQINNQGYQYFCFKHNARLIGFFAIHEEEDENRIFLSKLYIDKSARGNGYASMAFEYLENICKTKGYHSIWLTVNRYNKDTIHVYEKKGFQTVRTQVADIGNGYVMDDYIMEKRI